MSPSFNHAYIQSNLIGELRKNKKYTILSELTLDIDGKDYIPDISVYPKRKMDRLNDIIKVSEMPLLIIEILSPTQGTREIVDKFKICVEKGVRSCWLIEPFSASVTVYSAPDKIKTFVDNEIFDEILDLKVPIKPIFE